MQNELETICRVFIASANDVKAARDIVEKVCNDLTKAKWVINQKIRLLAERWESVFPSAGRPQDILNQLQRKCKIVVFIFYRKYGTGTMEEFFNAYDDWKKEENSPKIMVYFKGSLVRSKTENKDPQFIKILDFKDKIEKDELLLYRDFTTPKEFKKFLSADLESQILTLAPNPDDDPIKPTKKVLAIVSEKYRAWLNDITKNMDIGENREGGRAITVDLPELYVPLFSKDPDKKHEKGDEKDHSGIREPVEKDVEIETLAGRGETLLITGRAGSGKTTLAKYMARSIVNDQSENFKKGSLPILIYLSLLKKYPYENKDAKDLLDWCCKNNILKFLDLETILSFCENGRCVFILDGLDEADEGLRKFIDIAFADFRIVYKSLKVILLGRPHVTEGKVSFRLGDRKAHVRDLSPDQIRLFIDKWFSHVFGHGSSKGEELAKKMKSDILATKEIEDLTNNPLLLSTMCMLYNDSHELPDQRADLYRRYLAWLFFKLDEKAKVERFMMEMAATMMKGEDYGIDRHDAVRLLKKIYSSADLNHDHGLLFDRIEPATGLLEKKNGRYKFIHNTFREFLTARYFNHFATDSHYKVISPYIPKRAYEEVVKLFIGFLSLDNSGTANFIIEKIIGQKPKKGFYTHILAAEALLDIKKDHRKQDVETQVIEKMGSLVRNETSPLIRLKAAEAMGRLGYAKGIEEVVPISGGTYDLEGLGKKNIQAFEISKFPVTNHWYAKFIKEGGYETEGFWTGEGKKWLEVNKVTEPLYWRERRFNCPTSPVVGVSWYEAAAFCRWLTANDNKGFSYRLPTEEEWQAAAAGKEKREYPWGNEIDPQKCNYEQTGFNRTSPVGIFLQGKTPEGVHDLAGNVWEWTRSGYYQKKAYDDFPYDPEMDEIFRKKDVEQYANKYFEKDRVFPALRGGSFNSLRFNCRCANRYYDNPDERFSIIGFRCARIKL